MPAIADSRVLIIATHGFEELELIKPLNDFIAEGTKVDVAAPDAGEMRVCGTKGGENPSTWI